MCFCFEPVDRAAYAALAESIGGDAVFLAELVNAFVEDAARLVTAMRAAAAAGRAIDVAQAAHQLKSSSASLGAAILPRLCADLEAQARAGSSQNMVERVADIETEVQRVTQTLRALGTAS